MASRGVEPDTVPAAPFYHTFRGNNGALNVLQLGGRDELIRGGVLGQITYPLLRSGLPPVPCHTVIQQTSDVDERTPLPLPFSLVKKYPQTKHRSLLIGPALSFPPIRIHTGRVRPVVLPMGFCFFRRVCAIYGTVYPWRKAYQRFGHQSGGNPDPDRP